MLEHTLLYFPFKICHFFSLNILQDWHLNAEIPRIWITFWTTCQTFSAFLAPRFCLFVFCGIILITFTLNLGKNFWILTYFGPKRQLFLCILKLLVFSFQVTSRSQFVLGLLILSLHSRIQLWLSQFLLHGHISLRGRFVTWIGGRGRL